MRILILSNNDGGLYQFRKELIETLAENNEVVCSVPNDGGYIGKLEELGCKCIITNVNRRGMNPIQDLLLINKYIKMIKDNNPDAVLTYTIKPNIYGGIACQMMKIPYLANITGLGTAIENGGVLRKVALVLYKIGLRKANCVFFQNENNLESFKSKQIICHNYKLIPGSGVNVNAHCLEPYPKDQGEFRFLFVGRVMKDKGIDELINSIIQMKREGKKASLDIVGEYDDNKYKELLPMYMEKGLIRYHGEQKNVHKYYTNAQCVVLPSYHEGMANVMLEAASTGRPVITSNIPGCIETFDEHITGFGCEPRNVESLLAAMNAMYSLPWEERRQMGLAGREKVKKEFDRNIVVNAYLEELSSLQ